MYKHEGAAEGTDARKGLTVLIVDDDTNVLSALRRVFRKAEYDVFTSTEPAAIAERVIGWPDLAVVVSDHQMGVDMDGDELLTRVMEVQPHTTRIMMSGTHRPIEGVAHYFIEKPFDNKVVRLIVEKGIDDYLDRLAQEKK